MEHDIIARVIEGYTRLFGMDLSDFLSDLEESLYEQLEKEPVADRKPGHNDLFDLRKQTLYQMSQIPRLRGRIDRVLDDFQRQIDEQNYDFNVYRREEALPQEMVELMYEAQGLWNNMPHRLVAKHYNLVKKAAAKYHRTQKIDNQMAFSDLLSAANEALLSAANRMHKNPKKDFRSFAWKILKDKIRDEQSSDNPVPPKIRQKLGLLREKRDLFGIDGSTTSDLEQLATRTGLPVAEIKSLCEIEAVWGEGAKVDMGGFLEDLEVEDLSPNALDLLISQETCDQMSSAIATLPIPQRQLIDKIYFQEMSLREAAEHMKTSLNTIKKHHQKAIERLKEAFLAEEEDPAEQTG